MKFNQEIPIFSRLKIFNRFEYKIFIYLFLCFIIFLRGYLLKYVSGISVQVTVDKVGYQSIKEFSAHFFID